MKYILPIILAAIILSGCQKQDISENKVDNTFSTIKEAISKQLLLKCEYKDEDDTTLVTYIKGNTVRMEGTGQEEDISGLLKDNKYYLWSKSKKEGLVLDLTKMTEDGSISMNGRTIKSTDDVINVLEEKKNDCKLFPESSGLMEVPADVKFSETEGFLK